MLEFVQRAFRKWFSAVLWITLIGCIIGGLYLGWNNHFKIPAFLGAILGGGLFCLIGLITIILGGGLISTFLRMGEDIEQIRIMMYNNYRSSGRASSGSSSSGGGTSPSPTPYTNPSSTGSINPASGVTWICKQCNQKNPASSSSCKGCGAYK